MSWLDNFIAAVSPRRACERERWRQELETIRSYDAADFGRINAGWRVHNESAELTDRHSRDVLRARARDLERNSDIVQAILHAYKRNVVGKGFTLRAQTQDDTLDQLLERTWKLWCKADNCDVTGEQSFNEILRMMVERKKIDGGMLVLYRYTRGGILPFKLQCLEVDELEQSQMVPHKKGNRVVGGIEYDDYRHPVGYWIRQYDIEGWQQLEPVYVNARDVFFYKGKRRPSQLREISDLAPTMTRIRDTNEFITAVAMKERTSSLIGLIIKKAASAVGLGRSAGRNMGTSMDYAGKKMTPGMIMELGIGDDVTVVDPKGTADDATTFLKTQQGLIGAGQGLSYEAISRDMHGSTYSSARQNALEDKNTYAEEIELLTTFMSEVYENFVISGVLSGRFDIPNFWARQEVFLNHAWVKSPKKWIDPAKEANADKIALQSGQKTFQDLQAEKGKDWKDAVDELAELLAYGEANGIDMGGVIFGTGAAIRKSSGDPQHGKDSVQNGGKPGNTGEPSQDD